MNSEQIDSTDLGFAGTRITEGTTSLRKKEAGETDEEKLLREVEEEQSLKLTSETLDLYGIFQAQVQGNPEGVKIKKVMLYSRVGRDLPASSEIKKSNSYARKTKLPQLIIQFLIIRFLMLINYKSNIWGVSIIDL